MPLILSDGQALALWRQVTVNMMRQPGPDLSARQVAVFLTVYLQEGTHTVRGLAQELAISKPAVTRALDRLCHDDLLARKTDDNDRRSVLIQRTSKGASFLRDFSAAIREAGEAIP